MSTLTKTAAILLLILITGIAAPAQSTTNTQCTGYGNQVNCTSNTNTIAPPPDNSAQQAEQQRENYEAGQALGSALGAAIYAKRMRTANEKRVEWNETFCMQNPAGSVVNGRGERQNCAVELATVRTECTVSPKQKFCKLLPAFSAAMQVPQAPDHTAYARAPVPQPTQADPDKSYCANNHTDAFCLPKQ
jgi:hypothetical protein